MKELRDRVLDADDNFTENPENGLPVLLAVCGEALKEAAESVAGVIADYLLKEHHDRIASIPKEIVGEKCLEFIEDIQQSNDVDIEYALNIESYLLQASTRVGLPLHEHILAARFRRKSKELHPPP